MAKLNRDYRSVVADSIMRRDPNMTNLLDPSDKINTIQPWAHVGMNLTNLGVGAGQVYAGAFGGLGAGLGSIVAYKGFQRILSASGGLGESWGLVTDPKRREDFVAAKVAELENQTREEIIKANPKSMAAITRYAGDSDSLVNFYRTTGMDESSSIDFMKKSGTGLSNKFSPASIRDMWGSILGAGGGGGGAMTSFSGWSDSKSGLNNLALSIEISGFSRNAAAQLVAATGVSASLISSKIQGTGATGVIKSQLAQEAAGLSFSTRWGLSGSGAVDPLLYGIGNGLSPFGDHYQLQLNKASLSNLDAITTGQWDHASKMNQLATLTKSGWNGTASALDLATSTSFTKLNDIITSGKVPDEWAAHGLTVDVAKTLVSSGINAGFGNTEGDINGNSPVAKARRAILRAGTGGKELSKKWALSSDDSDFKKYGFSSAEEFRLGKEGMAASGLGMSLEEYRTARGQTITSLNRKFSYPTGKMTDASAESVALGVQQGQNSEEFEQMYNAALILSKSLNQAAEGAVALINAIPQGWGRRSTSAGSMDQVADIYNPQQSVPRTQSLWTEPPANQSK
jgi:hypothetical protein